jgi:hypothetical protein
MKAAVIAMLTVSLLGVIWLTEQIHAARKDTGSVAGCIASGTQKEINAAL